MIFSSDLHLESHLGLNNHPNYDLNIFAAKMESVDFRISEFRSYEKLSRFPSIDIAAGLFLVSFSFEVNYVN